ncbi:MAG: hypothetical protein ACHQT8_01435 [Chlamydiales bacterium]
MSQAKFGVRRHDAAFENSDLALPLSESPSPRQAAVEKSGARSPHSKEELLTLNRRGLIPGPQESDKEFWERLLVSTKTYSEWQETYEKTETLFDVSVDWVEIFYSKKSLPLWQGALTWLDTIPRIQLHPQLKKGSLFNLYSREEVLSHEAVHAARSQFNEPRFEEHFAYRTSKSAWRRCFGPLFRRSEESTLFLALLSVSTIATICGFPLVGLFSCAVLGLGFARLALAHRTFDRCRKNLALLVREPEMALPLMVRLTDREISHFAVASRDEIQQFIDRQNSLRWQMISAAYLPFIVH